MMGSTASFTVTIGRNGQAQVRAFPGIDTGEQVIFTKADLEKELTTLLEEAFRSGHSVGRESIRDELKKVLDI
jgi:hypothetical protein